MSDVFRLTRAELRGLIHYVGSFGDQEIPRMRMSLLWNPRTSTFTATSIGLKPAVSVSLERIEEEEWAGICSCAQAIHCIHCLATAAHALGLSPGAPAAEAVGHVAANVKPVTNPLDEIEGLIKVAHGREPNGDEKAYINAIRDLRRRHRFGSGSVIHGALSLVGSPPLTQEEMGGVERTLLNSGFVAFPSEPTSLLDFYHGVVRILGFFGLTSPSFMAEVLRLNPAPPEWTERWERDDANRWRKTMRDALEAPSLAEIEDAENAQKVLGIRIRLTRQEPTVELRWSEAEPWRSPARSKLRETMDDVLALRVATEPSSTALAFAVARIVVNHVRAELSYTDDYYGMSQGSHIAKLLGKAQLRPAMVCEDGTPVPERVVPASWHLVPSEAAADGSPTHYDIEARLKDGSKLPSSIAVAEGMPTWWIGVSSVHPLAPLPGRFVQTKRIPAAYLQDETAIRGLDRIGIHLPESLTRRVRRVPLKPVITLALIPDGKSQRVIATAVAHDVHGRVVEKFEGSEWMQITPKGRPPKIPGLEAGTILIHERSHAAVVEKAIDAMGFKWDGFPRKWFVRVTKRFAEDFHAWLQSIPPEVEVELPPDLAHFKQPAVEAQFQLQVTEAQVDWFDLSATITTGDPDLTPEELQLLLDAEGAFVNLPGKGWRRVRVTLSPEDQQHLAELGLATDAISSEPLRLHALQLNNPAAKRVLPETQAAYVQRRADEIQARVTPPVPGVIQASLRPYQLDGFHFLAYLSQNHFGGVLADDMGLGKTLQTLTWIAWLCSQPTSDPTPAETVPPRHVLIVCPKSVLPNWLAEAQRFLPSLRITAWSGADPASLPADLEGHDALVVNYAQLRILEESLAARTWLAVVLDEAQYIKNPDSQTAQAARRLVALHRLALTGTPIENRLLDLWSILAFAMPGALGPRAQFQRSFAKDDPLARRRLAARLRPFLLRRTKAQVATDLPDRIEEDILCPLEGIQKTLYSAEYKKARALLLGLKSSADLDKFRFHFLTSLLRLRQICCHAALVDPKHRKQASAKLEALVEIIEPLLAQGLKVLVFSQFTDMLDILRDALDDLKATTFLLTGSTEDRGPLVDSFNQHPGAAVFLISLKAGGFGLNLTSASYVVLFDPWWNPAVENQAIDRTHRIGQKSTVFAYRLVVQGSIEEKIRQLQRSKSALASDILGEERFSQALSIDDLRFLFDSPEASV